MKRATLVIAVLALAGCAGAGPYHAPEAPLPPHWSAGDAPARAADPEWWKDFHDPALDRLEVAGLAGNTDLAAALARLDQARAMARDANGARLPAISSSDSIARSRQSLESGLGRVEQYVPGLARTQDQADIGVSATWDLDLAGGLAKQARAAGADADAARAALAAARLATVAEIAQGWLDWRRAVADHALLLRQRALIADQMQIVGARTGAGDAALRDNDAAAAALAALDAALPDAASAISAARNRLAVLTGRPAGQDLPELAEPGDGAMPVAAAPAMGVPADLLRNRPDLAVAEAHLRASHARVGAALGEYWPHLSLSGLFGFSTNDLSMLGGNSANVITGAAGLRWRLFDFGRIDAEVQAARGGEREALANYRGAVLHAGADVENAFVALDAAQKALAARAVIDAAEARNLQRAQASERAGEISRIERVVAEARRIDAARSLLAAQANLAGAVITAHRALGG